MSARLVLLASLSLTIPTQLSSLRSSSFDPLDMPKGARITLPQPATTVVPLGMTLMLGATDKPQTLSIASISSGHKPIELQINEVEQNISRRVVLHPGKPAIYTYNSLGTIKIETVGSRPRADYEKIKLKIESNRPLEIYY